MSKILRSPAYPGGVLSYTPDDAWEAFVSGHANIHSWLSPEGVTYRNLDRIWDDVVDVDKTFYAAGSAAVAPTISARIGNLPTIEIVHDGHLKTDATLPASITVVGAFVVDTDPPNGVTFFGGATNSPPRLFFGTNSGAFVTFSTISGVADQISETARSVVAGQPFIAWMRYDVATKDASVGMNSTTGNSKTLTTDYTVTAGAGVGAFGNGANKMIGGIGDVLVFDAALSDVDLEYVVEGLARRTQIDLV